MIRVGRVAHDPLVLFVERVHRVPGKRDAVGQDVRECGESRVLPRTARSFAVAKSDGVPGRPTEVAMIGCPVGAPEYVGGDVPLGK